MRAAVYHGDGRLAVQDVPRPTVGAGELLVQVTACGLCGSDLMRWYQDPRAPVVLGHEPVGIVVEAGAGAPDLLGRRVAVHHHVPCMTCDLCRAGRHTLCDTFRRTRIDPGGLAEYLRVPAENARLDTLEIPDHLPDWAATLVEPLGCVVRGQRAAGVGAGRRVAVIGAGSMGLLQIMCARALGAAVVAAADLREERRGPARVAGALVPDTAEADALRDALGRGADQVFVTTAHPAAIALGIEVAGPGGVVQLFAPPEPGTPVPVDLGAAWFREVSITATYSAGPLDTRDALAMLAAGDVNADLVVSHRLPLERAAEAYRLADSHEAVKVVVEPGGGATYRAG